MDYFSLENWRLRRIVIEVVKIMRRGCGRQFKSFSQMEMSNTRSHCFKMRGGTFKGDVRVCCCAVLCSMYVE